MSSSRTAPSRRRFEYTRPDGDWVTQIVELPDEHIQMVCVLFEAYDNLALVRTPQAGVGRVYVYCWEGRLPLVQKVLRDMMAEFPLHIGEVHPGMLGSESLWDSANPKRSQND